MKKMYFYLPFALLTMATVSCKDKGKEVSVEGVNFDIANLDTTIAPGNDFFMFATGGWAKANPLKDEFSRYGSFDQLRESNDEKVKAIIEGLGATEHEQGSISQKIGDLYKIGMDSVKLNSDGAKPIQSQLDAINAATNVADIIKLVGEVRQYARSPFFGQYVGADDKNSSMNMLQLGQGGLGLGERDYYLMQDSISVELRKGYHTLIQKQFVNAGYAEADALTAADAVMKVETALAKSHFVKERLREPELNYHKMAVGDLDKKVAKFDWSTFFEAAQLKGFSELNVGQIEPIAEGVKLINTLPIEESKAYLTWCLIDGAASYLSDNFVEANFDFYGKQMSGRQAQQARWKRVVGTVNGSLSEAVGQMYTEKYFPAEAKERMLALVENLQVTLGERITKLDWMGDATKEKAHEKLNSFTVKIGYPDKWKDYSTLEVKNDSYWENVVRASKFDYNENVSRVGKPVDKTEWQMPPQMVNAYYMPSTNEICFPAGILQPPFFYLDGDDAVNYGAIGVVIGHEMSHGFDDQGAKYDKEGNLVDWWTPEDTQKFKDRSQVLVEHFNNIEVLPGLKANGKYTLGENIGDFGGLQIAYSAFEKTEAAKKTEKIDGYTTQQRFFLSYAGLWASHVREAEMRRLTRLDVHSLGEWRVNGTLPHIDAWYEAFNITPADSLHIDKEERADIW